MEDKITHLLESYKEQIYTDFEKIVNINSFSSNAKGIEEMSQALQDLAKNIDVDLKLIYSKEKLRPHLIYGDEQKDNFYAVIGHFDTVHSPESDFTKYIEKDGLISGPGTNDMKSGLVVALYSLAILQKLFPKQQLPIKALFNSDEEIGSYDSKEIIYNVFSGAKAGFVFEPGRLENNSIVTGRKGIFGLLIDIEGKPSHAGVAPWNGINAIVEAARIVTELEGLNDYDNGISVGCNTIEGGIAANVVAPRCKIGVDARYVAPEQKTLLENQISKILEQPTETGAKVSYEILHGRPPLVKTEASEALYYKYRAVSESLSITCGELATGGGSDANYLSAMGIPVIDAVGAVGDGSHTKKEYTIKGSVLDRIKIFCILMSKEMQES